MTLTPHQQAERANRIGSSDIAAIMGRSRSRTAADIWRRMVGRVGYDVPDRDSPMHWGSKLEPVIRAEYRERQILNGTPGDQLIQDPITVFGNEWEVAHLDAWLPGPPRSVVEIKTDADYPRDEGYNWGDQGTDQIPADYLLQVQWQIGISGYSAAECAVLVRGSSFRLYRVFPNEKLIAALRNAADAFYHEHVLTERPPATRDLADVRRLYEEHETGTYVELTPEAAHAVRRREVIRERIKRLERFRERLDHRILAEMAEAESARDPRTGMEIVTWRAHERTDLDAKAIREHHPDIALAHQRTTTVRPMRVVKKHLK